MVCSVGMTQPAVWIAWLSAVAASHLAKSPMMAPVTTSLIGGRKAEAQFLAVRQIRLSSGTRRICRREAARSGKSRDRRAAANAWSSRTGSEPRGSRPRTPKSEPACRPWRRLSMTKVMCGLVQLTVLTVPSMRLRMLRVVGRARMVRRTPRRLSPATSPLPGESFLSDTASILISLRGPNRPGFAAGERRCRCRTDPSRERGLPARIRLR